MKLNKGYVQTFIFLALYLFAVYFWSQPYHERKIPYGEYDAMSHFEVADYMAYNDKSFVYLPPYIDIRYGQDNDFKPHTLWYPPTFHAALGVIQVAGGGRMLPIYLLNTIMATFVIISVYFVVNSLFGFLPAILSSLLIIFSPRDFMPYLWGQWPERFGYALLPIVLYCFYRYFLAYSKHESKPIYLYLTALFLGMNFLVHPLSFFHSVAGIAVLYVFLAIKQKKFVFNWKHLLIASLIFLVIFMMFPYQTFNVFTQFSERSSKGPDEKTDLSRLFQWSLNPRDYSGSVPASYFSFRDMHGLWTLPFLLIGILFLVLRREERDLFLMAWLVSLYLIMHRDLIGKAAFLHRSLSATAHIFAPLTAIGAVYMGSLVKLPSNYGKYLKYGIAAVFVYFALSVNMASASQMLNKNTYNDFFGTLNAAEYEAAQWVLENVPASVNITVLGIPYEPDNLLTVTAKKIRWLGAASQHVNRFYYFLENKEDVLKSKDWYVMLDYTMVGPLNDVQTFNYMQEFEKNLTNHALVYNKNNIRVYKLAK